MRVVIDSRARIPLDAAVLRKGEGCSCGGRFRAVRTRCGSGQLGAMATVIVAGETEVDLGRVLDELGAMGIRRLMVEGGGTLIARFIRAGSLTRSLHYVGELSLWREGCTDTR